MNRSPSIIVISVLLVILATRLLAGRPSSSTTLGRMVLTVGIMVLAALSVAAAIEIWRRSQRALRLFISWLTVYLTLGAAMQVISQGASISEVAIWCVFVGAIGLAIAAHLRFVLRQSV